MKVALYCRVSTGQQTHESQLAELRDYCRRRGWQDVTEFSDVISGAKFSRIGLDALMGLVRKGRIDAVLCFRLDRLGRSLAHLAQLLHEFSANGVALIVPSQGIDTSSSNPAATLQLNVLAAVAQFERELIRERVLAGLAAAKQRGARFGRPRTAEKHEDRIAALLSEGRSIRDIAAALDVPKSTVGAVAKRLRQEAGQAPEHGAATVKA